MTELAADVRQVQAIDSRFVEAMVRLYGRNPNGPATG
jgi:hypothetical protein